MLALIVMALSSSCTLKESAEKAGTDKGSQTKTATETDTSSTDKAGADKAAGPNTNTSTGTGTDSGSGSATTASSTGTDTASSGAENKSASTVDPASLLSGDKTNLVAANKTDDKTAASNTSAGSGTIPSNVHINLAELKDDIPICTVGGKEIKIGDYKRMLRIQQAQANQAIVTDPAARARLVDEAKKRNIELTTEEKTKVLETAHKQKGQDPKQFAALLKQANATEAQFDQEVLQSGLAFKTSNAIIEQTLLSDLVNRELLAQGALAGGGEKAAMNKYLAQKHTKNFDALIQQTGLSSDALRDEIVKAELAKIQLDKIQSQVKVSDAVVRKLYDQNKDKLQHGERIKLATILILCPEKDVGPIGSVRKQVQNANPKLSEKELDATVAQYVEQAKQKTLILLGEARAKTDFAKLANENSNDPATITKKNGGDLGFLEKKDIVPDLANAVWGLKAGEVLPQIVKSELGFNIYKVTARQPAGQTKYEELKPTLEALAQQGMLQQSVAEWLEKKRKVVTIEFTPKFLAIANQSKTGTAKTN